ncbi:hypothetical protein [Mycobacterium sp. IDR2000157661]|uniref:hypothetical protein n=1 Tax=Mycobacterium sp. IDR2000157661 TaxID=2867005 RepID=UPI001EEA7E58|nr:hypothetical protein [Mycobacterium sp. IDR2000157661]ULE32370.1 hypothetical protein K3G64_19920 [Mycobacterium sp. IDR2000157661]
MIRSLAIGAAAAALACASATVVAGAEPAARGCTYSMSPPHVVSVSGTQMVTVTMSPAACDDANPFSTVACVQLEGGSGPGKCAQGNGTLPAQVYLSPFQPGATYIATGRGCASTGNPPESVCAPTGPVTATP